MAIFISDYIWKQTNRNVYITVPLNDVHPSKVYLFATHNFIKINFLPFIFELLLKDAIIESKTKMIIKQNEIILELSKSNSNTWETLYQHVDRKELIQIKKNIISEQHEKEKCRKEEKQQQKFEINKFLNMRQMLFNNEEKKKIQETKDEKLGKAMKEMNYWEKNFAKKQQKLFNQKHICIENEKLCSVVNPIPFPRQSGSITFVFTPRVLPTPKRESRLAEEEEWLRKEAEAIRASGFVPEELTDEQKDHTWLLRKGEQFMKIENYLGAVNAFVYGSKISPKMPIFYVRLAEAHLKLNNFYKAIEHATKAMELLTPAVEKNKNLRIESYLIRSEAFKNINESTLGALDLNSANELLK